MKKKMETSGKENGRGNGNWDNVRISRMEGPLTVDILL